MGHGD